MEKFPELFERLKTHTSLHDPAKQEIVAQLVADSAQLAFRAAAGEDVDRELAHVKSQAMNLGREERAFLSAELATWITKTIAGIFAETFPS